MNRPSGFPLPSTKGRLLVAAPPLADGNFDRTVVYVLEHNEGGALGVVLNRRSEDLDIEFDSWSHLIAPPAELFTGGPVETNALIALGRFIDDQGRPSAEPVDLDSDPLVLDPMPSAIRIFIGYAGWGAQQLDGELEMGAWIVLPFEVDDAFCADPDDLWRSVLRRQSGRMAWLADCPADVLTN